VKRWVFDNKNPGAFSVQALLVLQQRYPDFGAAVLFCAAVCTEGKAVPAAMPDTLPALPDILPDPSS
jgi:hypothetical protein